MNEFLKTLSSKIKNIFIHSEFDKRNDDGSISVITAHSRVIEGYETFPYGFISSAEEGKVMVFSSAGSLDSVKLMPVESSKDHPEIKAGDVAIYTPVGNSVICRKEGKIIEIKGNDIIIYAYDKNDDKAEPVKVVEINKDNIKLTGEKEITLTGDNIKLIGETGITFNGDDFGGIVDAKELKIQLTNMTNRINGIIDLFGTGIAPPGGGTVPYPAVAAVKLLLEENFDKIQNKKVKHG